jgi:uncharacterized membrane protein YfcA
MGDMSLYALLAGAAFLLAATKTSFPSAGILVVLLLATQLEARTALGILMPIYVFADVAALFFYRDRVRLGIALRLMPGALVGMAIAVLVGAGLSAGIFNRILGAVILATVTLTVVIGDRSSDIAERLPRWTVPLIGVVAGFATMIGNSSGPIVSIYLILGGLAKQAFVGTSSVFYLLVNLTKLPPPPLGLGVGDTGDVPLERKGASRGYRRSVPRQVGVTPGSGKSVSNYRPRPGSPGSVAADHCAGSVGAEAPGPQGASLSRTPSGVRRR